MTNTLLDIKGSKIPFLYVFCGYGSLDRKTKKINPTAGSYDLLRNRIIFSEKTVLTKINHPQLPTKFKREKRHVAWCTNINGVLHHVSEEGFGQGLGRVAKGAQFRSFHRSPRDIVLQTMRALKQK